MRYATIEEACTNQYVCNKKKLRSRPYANLENLDDFQTFQTNVNESEQDLESLESLESLENLNTPDDDFGVIKEKLINSFQNFEPPKSYIMCPQCGNDKLASCQDYPKNLICKNCSWKHVNHDCKLIHF